VVPSTPAPPQVAPPPARELPDLKTLTTLPQQTMARLEGDLQARHRADTQKGETVWLDTERDILISFFTRFRNGIYGVWNYPARAAERGEEGVSLLKITIAAGDGRVTDVEVVRSSGFDLLDKEAIAAVQKGSPYGRVSRHYTEETLTIFANFQYRIGSRGSIYGLQ
jgi:periplasmic protein TonB